MHQLQQRVQISKIKILIADDHAIVRDGLRSLFRGDSQFIVVAEAADGEEAVRLVEKYQPHVVIMDVSMPNLNGIEATSIIKKKYPDTKVLVLTVHENEEYIRELVLAGADGYVIKSAQKKEIFDAVRAVAEGTTFFSPTVSKVLIQGLVRMARHEEPFDSSDKERLTRREVEILRLIGEGMTSREIADKLCLSVTTVHTHRTNIMKKLDIHQTVNLVKFAIQKHLIEITPKA